MRVRQRAVALYFIGNVDLLQKENDLLILFFGYNQARNVNIVNETEGGGNWLKIKFY